ncbi:receptor-interacting serine/threonine-protein kinase 4-like isoform X1 [Ranitomeya imitator]|uniref:receptor-interacting serine/threonine-protein kinase 4-like isoform X1 n=2 Tax=Ranitomeya imitator TaxID=111125 RepID=UPI0037E79712
MQPLPPGDLSQLELVGYGGFGVVYRGRSAKLGMDIALKNTLRDDADDFKSLMKEKEMMAQTNYTYVLRLLGLYETQGRTVCKYGLVMEYMPYGSICTLFDRIKEVPWALKFQILHQVALSMNYLHHVLEPPIIHRDLKPHNVLLNKSLDVQLTDFGLAKNETSIALSQSMVGSLPYMPPEALQSYTCKPTKEFDVYSFAVLFWSVLSGQEPYKNANRELIKVLVPQNHRPDMNLLSRLTSQKNVPEAIQLMQECWDADPGKRPSFSKIIEQTRDMNTAYTAEIQDEIDNVLVRLRKPTSNTSQQNMDSPDGGAEMNPWIPDTNSINISIFREIFMQAENVEAQVPASSVTPESTTQDIVDAEDFLLSRFSRIVQAKPDLSEVLDVLFSKRMITQEELDFITVGSVQGQIRNTLRMIMNKGPESCMEFLQLMNRLHAQLMRTLQEDVI